MKTFAENLCAIRAALEELDACSTHIEQKRFADALTLSDWMILFFQDPETPAHPGQEEVVLAFRRMHAIATHMKGDPEAAIVEFGDLLQKYPRHHLFHSLKLVIKDLVKNASSLHAKDPEHEALEAYFNLLNTYDAPPWWLHVVMAMRDIKKNAPVQAKARILALLALSPNDTDFLGAAINIAFAIEDRTWIAELRRTVDTYLEDRPYSIPHQTLKEQLEKQSANPESPETLCVVRSS